MSDINAPVEFFVSSFSPVEFSHSDDLLNIGGCNLDNVITALVRSPEGEDLEVNITEQTEEHIVVSIPADLRENTMFFVILQGKDQSWNPVGPLLKINTNQSS